MSSPIPFMNDTLFFIVFQSIVLTLKKGYEFTQVRNVTFPCLSYIYIMTARDSVWRKQLIPQPLKSELFSVRLWCRHWRFQVHIGLKMWKFSSSNTLRITHGRLSCKHISPGFFYLAFLKISKMIFSALNPSVKKGYKQLINRISKLGLNMSNLLF